MGPEFAACGLALARRHAIAKDDETMAEQATCKCGRPYSPQQYLPGDTAKCPGCGQELCLAKCTCGTLLMSAHRQLDNPFVWRSVVDFKCPDCGNQMAVKLESRRNRVAIAMFSAILFGAIAFGGVWWQSSSIELALLAGIGAVVLVVTGFYIAI